MGSKCGNPAPPGVSLKAAALRLLSRREFSRHELAQRLAPRAASGEQLEAVLNEFAERKYQSDDRFVASLVHRRAGQFGARRIAHELGQHQIDPSTRAQVLSELAESERERALAVWRRKFSEPAHDLNEKARQYRYLVQRGFDGETISWVLKAVRAPVPER